MNAAATACRERTRSLFEDDLSEDAGVLQVVSCWRTPMGGARVIAINASAPASPTDRFVLHLARSRADAIVTTGSILRAEPKLTHGVAGPAKDRAELDAWRRESLGRSASPLSLVLTGGEGLDLDHSLFQAGNPCVIYTGEDAAERLRAAGSERGIEVVGHPTPSLRKCIALGSVNSAKLAPSVSKPGPPPPYPSTKNPSPSARSCSRSTRKPNSRKPLADRSFSTPMNSKPGDSRPSSESHGKSPVDVGASGACFGIPARNPRAGSRSLPPLPRLRRDLRAWGT